MNEPLPDPLAIERLHGPLNAVVKPPGSKSITNRALICAALADGASRLDRLLDADDTRAMIEAIVGLGARVETEDGGSTVVTGVGRQPKLTGQTLDARQSGTTARFVLPALCLGYGQATLSGHAQLRQRPMGPIVHALRTLGASLTQSGSPSGMPIGVDATGLRGGVITLPGDTSSQFLSGLLLAAPCMTEGLRIQVSTELVSRPYIDMTIGVMRSFGAHVAQPDMNMFIVDPTGYRCVNYMIEPDASAASYPWAAAVMVGGSVTVSGIGTGSLQGDVAFVDVLERMGARIDRRADRITVTSTGVLHGVTADLTHISDTAPTFAVVAACADSPSSATGIGFIRAKESDRITAVVNELTRCGVTAVQDDDGFTVHPGPLRPTVVRTYDDHRMAMSFALLGLVNDGIAVTDPGCVTKTYPGYWRMLEQLRMGEADDQAGPSD